MIIGAHSILYSRNPDADRGFLRDVLKLPNVDVGGGWLIFALPPAEVAVHPSDENDVHEFYLMCDDVTDFIAKMEERKIACSPVENPGWGLLTRVTLPGGGRLGVYQPRHARPQPIPARKSRRKKNTASPAEPRRRVEETSVIAPRSRGGARNASAGGGTRRDLTPGRRG